MFAKQARDLLAPTGPAAVCAGQMRLLSKVFSQTPNFSVTNCRYPLITIIPFIIHLSLCVDLICWL